MHIPNLKKYLNLFKEAWEVFKENHPVEFASSIAYFSLFGLPSIFLIVIFLLGLAFDTTFLYQKLEAQLKIIIGGDAARILVIITERYAIQASMGTLNLLVYVISVLSLSTQLIVFFQDILNNLWQVKPDFKSFWMKLWIERGLTFVLVLITGLLFFVSTVIELSIETLAGGNTETTDMLINIITAIFVFLWISLLYKILPFVKIQWEPTLIGAAVTSILFLIGVWLLLKFVVDDGLEDLYDYVAPIVLVALWLFYNSLAFLYGASFTKVYAEFRGKKMEAAPYAYRFRFIREGDQINK